MTLFKASALALAVLTALVRADEDIYIDGALSSTWQNWGWSTTIDFAATDLKVGQSSIKATSDAWAAISLKSPTPFVANYEGLTFDIAADPNTLQLNFESTAEGTSGTAIPFTAISSAVNPNAFTTVVINFKALPPGGTPIPDGQWDRIDFQAGGNGATYHLDNIRLLTTIVVEPKFLSAEPLASDILAVTTQGKVDFSTVSVKLNGKAVTVSGRTDYSPVDSPSKSISYFKLSSQLAPGSLVITAGGSSFNYTLPTVQYGAITKANTKAINPLIYGANFPRSADYIKALGVTISRWGGNAVTPYNPNGDFTNAGNDWFFENRVSTDGNADAWLGWVKGAASKAMLTIPALDWVAKDATSYSYPKTVYTDQQKFDTFNTDAGNGLLPNGSWVAPPDPSKVYTPWNSTLAKTWLQGLKNKPEIVTIDNEIEIASSTHQDMHPTPVNYDEELRRVVEYAKMAKDALPNVLVGAPSTCSWWFYWTSVVGFSDNAAHNNIDFLPWFLQQMKVASDKAGKRLLDYLDIHYYFQADTSANDAAAKAKRARATRSLYDPGYIDESWIGTDPVQNHQPNAQSVWVIPRMRQLINQFYPGTKLSISEWAALGDQDVTGGLMAADTLGIFGKESVDAATYWATPDEKGPVGHAFWLFRGYGTYFGSLSAQVNLATSDAVNKYGVYAGVEGSKLSVVIVNKDPAPLALDLSNLPTGSYFIRHFGGGAGVAKWQTTSTVTSSQYIVIPGWTAIFLLQK